MTTDINKLRRLAQAAAPGPDGVSLSWITLLQDFQQAANPAAISELLDRLEAAESALSNLGVTPDEARDGLARHKATLARLEAAEKERDDVARQLVQSEHGKRKISEEYDAMCAMLRAGLEVLEDVKGNINPERGYADELEADVERTIATIVIHCTKGE